MKLLKHVLLRKCVSRYGYYILAVLICENYEVAKFLLIIEPKTMNCV